MILEGQPTSEDLQASHFADLQTRRQSTVDRTATNKDRFDALELLPRVDQKAIAPNMEPHFEDITIDRSHRLIPPSSDGLTGRLGLIAGALIAASGWVVISILPLPFTSGPAQRLRASLPSSVGDADLKKRDRLQIPNAIIGTPVSAGSRETPASTGAPTSSQRSSTEVPRQTKERSTEVPRRTTSVRASVRDLVSTVKLVPTPDTRPTTIEGWTLRDVANGTAVLEGPDGTWRAARGDTVPGLGRVESILKWGNRLIVATSSGLISTP
jgi:hypothetical protein